MTVRYIRRRTRRDLLVEFFRADLAGLDELEVRHSEVIVVISVVGAL